MIVIIAFRSPFPIRRGSGDLGLLYLLPPLFGVDMGVSRDFRLAHDNRREVELGLLEVD